MRIVSIERPFEDVKQDIKANLTLYSEPVDSYYEDHIIESNHYVIMIDDQKSGYYSVFENYLLTQFALELAAWGQAQEIFKEVLRISQIKEIYCSTSDQLLLMMALGVHKEIIVQDYIFQRKIAKRSKIGFHLSKAEEKDIQGIKRCDEGFFSNLENNIKNGQLYIGKYRDAEVTYGIIEMSKLLDNQASIGMFVLRDQRGKGFGAQTIIELMKICREARIHPIAGCFVKNQYSVSALTQAGMVIRNQLLKIKV